MKISGLLYLVDYLIIKKEKIFTLEGWAYDYDPIG